MTIDANTVVSMTEANQNFSRVARVVDKYGKAVVFKNNAPRYLIVEFPAADKAEHACDEDVLSSARKLMDQYDAAFAELAK